LVVGGVGYDLATTITLPGTPAAPVIYNLPVSPDLTFTATADPAVFTAVVP
jgi:hypothetical protein